MKKVMTLSLMFLIAHAHAKPAQPNQAPKQPNPTPLSVFQSDKPSKPKNDAPITQEEATAVLQVAAGFLQILTDPNDPTHITTGVGAMASGMANLLYQLMKSKGVNAEMTEDELQDLAQEVAEMVNRGVAEEIVRRSTLSK